MYSSLHYRPFSGPDIGYVGVVYNQVFDLAKRRGGVYDLTRTGGRRPPESDKDIIQKVWLVVKHTVRTNFFDTFPTAVHIISHKSPSQAVKKIQILLHAL